VLAQETGKTIPQVAPNWVLQRPTISSVIIGARNEKQMRENLESTGWNLTADQVARLDAASETTPPTRTGISGRSRSEIPSPRR
jgi:aryl-alcohol dehydrogenase-like predicted oxidoreductase